MERMRPVIVLVASLSASSALGADIVPAPEPPASQGQSQGQQPKPEATPPVADPGMVKQPETVPDPNSVVNPPVVDPKMAINPEATPSQPAEPSERRNQEQAPKKQ